MIEIWKTVGLALLMINVSMVALGGISSAGLFFYKAWEHFKTKPTLVIKGDVVISGSPVELGGNITIEKSCTFGSQTPEKKKKRK